MKTILQVNSVANGSTGFIMRSIKREVEKHGDRCICAIGRGEPPNEKDFFKFGTKSDFLLHALCTRLTDRHGLFSKEPTKKLIALIEKTKPDVLHLHNIHGYYLNYPLFFEYIARTKQKVVWTLHDCWAFTGHCSHYIANGCTKWQSLCENCPQKNAYPKSVFLDASKQNFLLKKRLFSQIEDLTLAVPSNWLAKQVKQSFLKDKKIAVIPNGIDIEVFTPRPKTTRQDKKIVLGVAAIWSERKGFDVFLEIAKKIPEAQIVLVGSLSKEQKKILPKNIKHIERTENQKELAELYSAADVFVNPTTEDNFPTVNLEAIACGTPVATFDAGGSAETVKEDCGASVPAGDTPALIEKTIGLMNAEKLAPPPGLSAADMAARYISLYKN